MNNINKIWTDYRGNRWIKATIDKSDQHFLNTVRKNWMDVSDEDIYKAKQIVLEVFNDKSNVKGSPYSDFIHLFNSNNNYFVLTDIYKEPTVLKYECEYDMHLNPNINFEEMQISI